MSVDRSSHAREGHAARSLVELDSAAVPLALAALHRDLEVDESAELVISERGQALTDLLTGAGFAIERTASSSNRAGDDDEPGIFVRRLPTLPDTVGSDMVVLVCGLNPSVHSAEMGVGFGRAGNRFWPAALAAGLVSADRDPHHALAHHRVGMTDLVKRATPRADALTREEYEVGVARLDRLCQWLRPGVVCMVGLAGWRSAIDRKAIAGVQDRMLGGRPVYVMPSTSGLNAHSNLADLTHHLELAQAVGARSRIAESTSTPGKGSSASTGVVMPLSM